MRTRLFVPLVLLASASLAIPPFGADAAPVVLAAQPAAPADSWPGFRGPAGDGRADAKNVPTLWSEKENVRWKTAIHGKGWSSPVVLGDRVWVTTADEVLDPNPQPKKGGPPANPVKAATLCAVGLDRATGRVLHDVKLHTAENPQYCHP